MLGSREDNGHSKMERFPIPDLRDTVKNAIEPESELEKSVDTLLKDVFKQ